MGGVSMMVRKNRTSNSVYDGHIGVELLNHLRKNLSVTSAETKPVALLKLSREADWGKARDVDVPLNDYFAGLKDSVHLIGGIGQKVVKRNGARSLPALLGLSLARRSSFSGKEE
ncbi:hypothetical protein U1Q18_052746 [Sarracenia purpurea var. burkii]